MHLGLKMWVLGILGIHKQMPKNQGSYDNPSHCIPCAWEMSLHLKSGVPNLESTPTWHISYTYPVGNAILFYDDRVDNRTLHSTQAALYPDCQCESSTMCGWCIKNTVAKLLFPLLVFHLSGTQYSKQGTAHTRLCLTVLPVVGHLSRPVL